MILTVVLIAIGIGAALFSMTGPRSVAIANKAAKENQAALAQAKEALIGRSVGDVNRPGSLPCPDTDDDGVAEIFAGTDCPSYIGRLPWRTLGLPDLRDSSGERLWYMLSSRFRDHINAQPINTDTKGNVTVYTGSTSTTLTAEAVAVIFAPGPAIGNQNRDAAGKNNPANYLESGSGWNNASASGPYLLAQSSATLNDRLLVITTTDLMTPVERRAAKEILQILAAYPPTTGKCNCYPWADITGDGVSDYGSRYGGIPLVTASTYPWPSPTPAWLRDNQWYKVIYYAVSEKDSDTGGKGLTQFTVNGATNIAVVLITTGPAVTGDNRPSTNWADYVNDLENRNNDDIFITPASTAYARDRLYRIP